MIKPGFHKIAEDCYDFTAWTPYAHALALEFYPDTEPLSSLPAESSRTVDLAPLELGYWSARIHDVRAGQRYGLRINNAHVRPDPFSHYQPEGVHGASMLVEHDSFTWEAPAFQRKALVDTIFYEVHVGTFTPEGTFDAATHRLDELADFGITDVELMPVAQCPGTRNWGYDGTYPYAVQNAYGGPDAMKRFVDACHTKGLGVVLDVVYNHLGPEGNYLQDFGPFFTKKYATPWGGAVNFDGPHSDGVREFFLQNALHWFEHYRVDGLRLDATPYIYDGRPKHFLRELAQKTRAYEKRTGRSILLVAESDMNEPDLTRTYDAGGKGLDAAWSDDFHHAVHAVLTGETAGYYVDFGSMQAMADAVEKGFCFQGAYSAYRKRAHGPDPGDVLDMRPEMHVTYLQNHDQVGNRVRGERLASLIPFEGLKAAAALHLLAPGTPLLFMGEEYGEDAPFLFFIDHGDEATVRSVRRGRKREYKEFGWTGTQVDPQKSETFMRSKLHWSKRGVGHHKQLLDYYRELIILRKKIFQMEAEARACVQARAIPGTRALSLRRGTSTERVVCLINFSAQACVVDVESFFSFGQWWKLLDSTDNAWGGKESGLPLSFETRCAALELPGYAAVVYLG